MAGVACSQEAQGQRQPGECVPNTFRHHGSSGTSHCKTHTHTHTEQLLCVFVYRNVKKKNTLKEARLLCVSMATGLFAISGCHGNSFSERIAEWLSYILQPQEGTACPQFDYMLFRLSHNFQYFSKKNTTYNWQHCHKVVVVGGFFVLFFCMFSHYFTGFHLVQRHVHWGLG